MDYSNYDNYIRNMFGYPDMHMNPDIFRYNNFQSDDLERMYPETYKIIYPIICNTCDTISMPINETNINIVVDDIFSKIEKDDRIKKSQAVKDVTYNNSKEKDARQVSFNQGRPNSDNLLRDLIKILLLQELLRRRPRFPYRQF